MGYEVLGGLLGFLALWLEQLGKLECKDLEM